MPQIPDRVLEVVEQLRNGKQPRRTSVKKLLKWFGAHRRTPKIISEIQNVLRLAGVTTNPDWLGPGMDGPLRFVLTSDIRSSSSITQTDPSQNGSSGDDSEPINQAASATDQSSAIARSGEGIVAEQPPRAQIDDRPVVSQPHDWVISALREKWDRGLLNLQPHYQRQYVWELRPELPSRLIESVLLEIPIPPLYFGKLAGGGLEVIDGQQRLKTLINFVTNSFPLRKLSCMPSLEGKKFRELSEEYQEKIRDFPIRTIVIDTVENPNLRYEIFERLNRGSMALNAQELRNCVYRGPFNELLGKLEKDRIWRAVKDGLPSLMASANDPEPRFIEREMILRFFALANRLNFYTGKLKQFLNDYMRSYAPQDDDQINIQAASFQEAMENVHVVFGINSGRLYSRRRGNDGAWETKFAITALEIQASALLGHSRAKVQLAADQIRDLFVFFLFSDQKIQDALSKHTSGTKETIHRWTAFRSQVQPILDGTIVEPRFFDFEHRKGLYDKLPVCQICRNQIRSFEDSTVDHIIPYSKGGKTIPDNGQLAHRWCNAQKNIQLPPQAAGVS